MKSKLISVIIPIYNVSNYLDKCLQTVINQTYSNIEIILIDDGSTDGSGNIAEKYAKKDNRITLVHKNNEGISEARNKGLSLSHGEYVTFIDSDDYVSLDYVSYLYSLLYKYNFKYPISMCSLMNVYANSGKFVSQGNGEEKIISGADCIKDMCYGYLVDTCSYAKLVRKDLYNKIKFPRNKVFEDMATTYLLFDQCDYVVCGFKPKYFYFIHDNSITNSPYNTEKLDLLEMTDNMANYISNKYPNLKKATLRRQVYARFSTLNHLLGVKNRNAIIEKQKILRFLKTHRHEIFKDSKVPKRDKLAYITLFFGLNFYSNIWKRYKKIFK